MKQSTISLHALLICTLLMASIYCSDKKGASNNPNTEPNQGTGLATQTANRNLSDKAENFVAASSAVTPAVVHIKTRYNTAQAGYSNPLEQLYGAPRRSVPVMGSGSGVIITADGYIATNNHVIEDASAIEVILPDRRSFSARLVGQDPNTDLALLKINANRLPVVPLGNSDNVQVGEWVLAIGYPLSLNTTVTAGIISAKGRSIGIINQSRENDLGANPAAGSTAIESFLQTDAAINPGNSGGALVNTNGELIGINTAIASQTGSYAGYAFAIPVNLAKKILDDLKQYGSVKRGVLGVSFPSPAAEDQYLRQQGINPGTVKGVYIINVLNGSAADLAGLKEGDIIQSIDGVPVTTSSEFSERIARHRPGDKVTLTYLRNGKSVTVSVTLKEESNTAAENTQPLQNIFNKLGASFAPLPEALKERYDLTSGVIITDVQSGGFFDQLGIPEGTIIVMINGKPVNTPEEVGSALLAAQSGIIQILGIAPDGSRIAFNFSLGT
ncbi:MAG: trypsin-like peptidase domain-containing protein [Bacteroidota bacterium]|nr:trypsin-like peptidase domain-containing protein [Bacteroidota bacterium]